MRNLTEENLTEAVLARMTPEVEPRFRQVITLLVKHLHAFVREAELKPEEWERGIRFLTDSAKFCDDKRQEFILLSDVLGVSMLVDAIANRAPAGVTESTVMGPFFRDNPPRIDHGGDLSPGIAGPRCQVDARVLAADGKPVAGAQVDVWQASADGFYDSQIGDGAAHTMRGRLASDREGRVRFSTVVPSSYPVPNDGPVGDLLRAMGRHPMRPAHIHFWISAPGYRPVVTHLFVAGDKYLDSDAVFGVKNSLVVDFKPEGAGKPVVRYDFRLQKAA